MYRRGNPFTIIDEINADANVRYAGREISIEMTSAFSGRAGLGIFRRGGHPHFRFFSPSPTG